MSFTRALRAAACSVVLALAVSTVTTTGADAATGKPAPAPTGLAATVTAHANGSYDVDASWNATANATGYRVALTKGGATLASTTVKTASWSPTVTATPGNASLSVRAVLGKKPGRTASVTVPFSDVSPPQGSYSRVWDNNTGLATITQDSLTDNSPVSGVTRTVSWGVGSPVAWPTGTTITHTFPLTEQRYTPTVTLEDAAHNVTVIDVAAIVINDSEAPTGSFTSGPATAWAKLTPVTLSQTAIHDNWSPDATIARVVDWQDGSAPQTWTGATLSHVYTTGGTFTPQVTLTDEAGNPAPAIATTAVTVKVDSVGPRVKFVLPKSKHSVKAFRTLKGKATDTGGTGVKNVTVKAIEKRGTAWYGYNATTKRWIKASSKARAFTRARAMVVKTAARHIWTAKLSGLRKGTLVYRAFAKDKVANKSATITHKATLTRR
jgi:hypothetical protein